MWIDCLWVSGQLAGHGYADELLERCFMDTRAQGRQGMAILASDKKRGFLADPRFLEHKGFTVADQAGYFRLYWKPIDEMVQPPRFLDCAKSLRTDREGLVLYYTHQCLYGQVCPRRPGGGGAARRPLSGCPPGERGAGQGESIALYRVQPVLAGGICDP